MLEIIIIIIIILLVIIMHIHSFIFTSGAGKHSLRRRQLAEKQQKSESKVQILVSCQVEVTSWAGMTHLLLPKPGQDCFLTHQQLKVCWECIRLYCFACAVYCCFLLREAHCRVTSLTDFCACIRVAGRTTDQDAVLHCLGTL